MSTYIRTHQRLSRRKIYFFSLIIFFIFIIIFITLAEWILRGYIGPWVNIVQFNNIERAGFAKHSTLGYIIQPGKAVFTLPGQYSFIATHLTNGSRITHPLDTYPSKTRKKIWIFGCSFTYGWFLNDEQTYPWLLQKRFKDYEVVNLGLGGYSTLQSLLKFREALKNDNKPELVILAYGSFHDIRNTCNRSWVKQASGLSTYNVSLPCVRLSNNNKLQLVYLPLDYHSIPLARHSALANYLDYVYNNLLISKNARRDHYVSRLLIEEFSDICKKKEITFVIAGIDSDYATADMLEYFNKNGTLAVDISVDLNIKENNNLPYEAFHPSAIANKKYAQKLESFLLRMKLIN